MIACAQKASWGKWMALPGDKPRMRTERRTAVKGVTMTKRPGAQIPAKEQ